MYHASSHTARSPTTKAQVCGEIHVAAGRSGGAASSSPGRTGTNRPGARGGGSDAGPKDDSGRPFSAVAGRVSGKAALAAGGRVPAGGCGKAGWSKACVAARVRAKGSTGGGSGPIRGTGGGSTVICGGVVGGDTVNDSSIVSKRRSRTIAVPKRRFGSFSKRR